MTVSAPAIGHGTVVNIIGPTGTATINAALACESVSFGSLKVDTHDVTDMASSGNTRKFVPGLVNSGDVSLKFFTKPGDVSQQALETALNAGLYDFSVVYPGTIRTRSFTGIVTSIDEEIPNDKPATKSAKIQISGAITDLEGSVTIATE